MTQGQVQLGKNGITENFIITLKHHFNRHDSVKVSVLKGATRDKSQLQEYQEKILQELGNKYTAKVIGFTIVLKKWRRAVR